MSAPAMQPEAPAYDARDSVSVTVKDAAAPAPPAGAGLASPGAVYTNAAPLAPGAVPYKWTRLGLLVAALVCALVTIIAQAVMMAHSVSGVYGYYYYYTVTYKGADAAKAPGLVIATGVLALVLAAALLVLLFFPLSRCMPKASAHGATAGNMWTGIVEVALVGILLVLWLASLGVAAKTADIIKDTEVKQWVGGNGAALAFICISLLLWIAILVFSILALLGSVRAWKAHRQAYPPAPKQQHPVVYAVPQQQQQQQQPAVYAVPPQQPAAYAEPQQQQPAVYAAPPGVHAV